MAIKTILAPLLGRPEDRLVLDAALVAGRLQGAHVFATFFGRDPRDAMVGQVGEGMSAAMIESLIESAVKQLANAKDEAAKTFRAWASDSAVRLTEVPDGSTEVTASFDERIGDPAGQVSRCGRLASVTVVVRGENDGTDAQALMEAAMLETGRAVLLVPADVKPEPIKGIALAWNGSREAARAMALAMPMLEQVETVALLAGLSGSLTREDVDSCVIALGWHGVSASAVTFDAGDGNIAGRLQAEAKEAGCQLLVLGAYSHSRLREFIFGGVTDDILAAVRMPVLLAH